jgi:hypothetical protein
MGSSGLLSERREGRKLKFHIGNMESLHSSNRFHILSRSHFVFCYLDDFFIALFYSRFELFLQYY